MCVCVCVCVCVSAGTGDAATVSAMIRRLWTLVVVVLVVVVFVVVEAVLRCSGRGEWIRTGSKTKFDSAAF